MKNVFWIIPDSLAGRSGPSREPWALDELQRAGFGAVLNVSEFEPVWFEFEKVGLDVVWVPLPNHYPATVATEEACLRLLPKAYEFIQKHLDARKAVLVHCAWGQDRTGLILAYHLVQTAKLSPREAIARVRQVRPKALTALGWEEMCVRIFAQLQPQSQGAPAVMPEQATAQRCTTPASS